VDRCHGRIGGCETALGWVPKTQDFDMNGLDGFGPEQFEKAQSVVPAEWQQEVVSQEELFIKLHATLPKELIFQKELLVARL